ncbi:MAG TPA: gephyrin-like molybdotransferase Glp [Candidatus Acidoferrales bacterium]|jgi:molybdopterin molybdotransferase|nr:gephyrin-like molybdotransferase Glp [Candidatus Acidoferrales bacterium]
MISFETARDKVIQVVTERANAAGTRDLPTETIDLGSEPSRALGRILMQDILADRNYPPFNRSIRDGFAVRAADATEPGARLRVVGESRAGVAFEGVLGAGECVHIFTGAPVPRGSNAVVMQEHTHTDEGFIVLENAVRPGQHYVLAGAESRVGEIMVTRGTRLSYAELAMAAEVGQATLQVTRKPRVAIISTGDELVALGEPVGPFQIRNSNSISLAAQVTLSGGEPIALDKAPDDSDQLRIQIQAALDSSDILVLSGGVSVGKYDLVEQVLRELGTEVFFDAVAIRPGKPAVFGVCGGKPVFGLPGNPVSTMVTFQLFVEPAIEILSGSRHPRPLPFFRARLKHPVNEKGIVAHFLPARVTLFDEKPEEPALPVVETLLWEGSGDIGAVVRGNCFLVVRETRLTLEAGEWVDVMPRRGKF